MAWENLAVTKPHLVYIILGGFTTLFMLCSSFIKESLYIGEATIATIVGVIFGPHAANLINPLEWGHVDLVTLEFSRIVLVVQCFAIGVELPKFYMEKHWKSVVYLLIPVMTWGWLITSLFVWWLVQPMSWLDALVVAACVTATDPVLASAVVGKGKFSRRVPKHLRDVLSAESGCNDGMAFPFIYLSLYLIQFDRNPGQVTFHWIVYIILYECIFGAVYGFLIGYLARHGIRYAEQHDLIDRESFLVFYFVVALFCAGSGSILGLDDLLVGFAAGVGFSNDGWFREKTEQSHVSDVIDLLLNLTYFVYLGTIIPWDQYNNVTQGLSAWKLSVMAILVILFRRIPIMLALKPLIPDLKTWREALFAGHFGPIGVGAIYVALLARGELEHHEPEPLGELPALDAPNYHLLYVVWPIVTFMVIASMIVHGSSVAVFALGKRINTLTITMSYTQANEEGPSWMNRLPRISSQSRSQAQTMSDTDLDELKHITVPAPIGLPGQFLRRQKEDDSSRASSRTPSLLARRRKSKWDAGIPGPGGPVTPSAIGRAVDHAVISGRRPAGGSETPEDESPAPPRREDTSTTLVEEALRERDPEKLRDSESSPDVGSSRGSSSREVTAPKVNVYDEGDNVIFENEDGDVLAVEPSPRVSPRTSLERLPVPSTHDESRRGRSKSEPDAAGWSFDAFKRRIGNVYSSEVGKRRDKDKAERRHVPARAFQIGNTIIVEDEDGEVVKTYELPSQKAEDGTDIINSSLKMMGLTRERSHPQTADSTTASPQPKPNWAAWSGFGRDANQTRPRKRSVVEEKQDEDDKHIRFTINGVGQRMTKEDFLKAVSGMDARTRGEVAQVLEDSQPQPQMQQRRPSRRDVQRATDGANDEDSPTTRGKGKMTEETERGRPITRPSVRGRSVDVREEDETEIEWRRRLMALSGDVADDKETPAERRRREAALGMSPGMDGEDSDDEGGERVPPRKGIRFAETPEKKKRT